MGEDDSSPGTVTQLLQRSRDGDASAREELFAMLDAELRQIARGMLSAKGIRPRVMRGTELVNAACVKLLGRADLQAEDRAHFFFLIGRAMKDAIADEARRAEAAKRGGGRQPDPMIEIPDRDGARPVRVLELSEAMSALRKVDAEAADALEHHFLAGQSLRQTADLMGVSLHTVRRLVAYGTAWLRSRLGFDEETSGSAHGETAMPAEPEEEDEGDPLA